MRATGTVRPWTDQEINQFEARWVLGTEERTIFDLMLGDGLRACEIVAATCHRPMQSQRSPELATTSELPVDRGTKALRSRTDKLFSIAGLERLLLRAVHEAGLPQGCKLRGLRKRHIANQAALDRIPDQNQTSNVGSRSTRRAKTYVWSGPRPEDGRGRVLSPGPKGPCDRAPEQRVSAHAGNAPSAGARAPARQRVFSARPRSQAGQNATRNAEHGTGR